MKNIFAIACCVAAPLFAAGGRTPVPVKAPTPGVAEIRIRNETIPPDGTVQLKFVLTEPKPIMMGSKAFGLDAGMFDDVFGIALSSPGGDAFGIATYGNAQVQVQFMSPLGTLGTAADYPILTVAAHVRQDAARGATTSISLAPGSGYTDPLGQTTAFVPKPGTITVGGSLSIHDVVPGIGVAAAGSVVRVLGSGFNTGTKVSTTFAIQSFQLVSSSEIDLVVAANTAMNAQRVTLTNVDGIGDSYFSYLRGVTDGQSAEPVVASAVPVFPLLTSQRVLVAQQSAGITNSVLTALAVQNPNTTSVAVSLEASSPMTGTIATSSVTLAPGHNIVRELGEFFGRSLPPATSVRVIASAPIQLVGFTADRATGALGLYNPSTF